jgi:signal transduction histidine kinase
MNVEVERVTATRTTSLRLRIMAVVAVGLTTVMAVVGLWGISMLRDNRDHLLQERLMTAQALVRRLDDALLMATQHLAGLAAAPELRTPAAQAPGANWDAVAGRVPFASYDLYLVSARGVVQRTVSGRVADLGADFSMYDEVRSVLNGRRMGVSALLEAPGTRAPIVLLCVAADPGALCAAADLRALPFDQFIGGLALGRTGHAVIVDNHGRVIASTDADDRFGSDEHPDFHAVLIAKRAADVGPALYYKETKPVARHIMAFAPSRVAPWGVSVGQTEAETLTPVTLARRRMLGMAVLTLAAALLFAWWDTGSLIRPLRRLASDARRIAGGDFGSTVSVERSDEIGELASSFEVMRTRLRSVLERLQVMAVVEERERIGRDLHDSTLQSLFGITLALESAKAAVATDPSGASARLDQILAALGRGSEEIRAFVHGLHRAPAEGALATDLEALVADIRARGAAEVSLHVDGPEPLASDDARAQLPLIVKEAASNAIRHGGAAHVDVTLTSTADGSLQMQIRDDGCGFVPASPRHRGEGIRNMSARAVQLGGHLDLDSRPGGGTTVTVTIPRPREVTR